MKVVLHGSLKGRFLECEIKADTVAEAIEGWSRQCGMNDVPLMMRPTIDVVGFDTIASLGEKTDVEEIHLIPSMFGGGGNFGQILIGAALIAAAFIPGLGFTVQIGLLAAGIGMTVGGVMGMFMKSPTVSSSNDPDPSKYLGAKGNTTTIGTLISKGYGRFKVGGQYMSLQVNSQDMVFGSFPAFA